MIQHLFKLIWSRRKSNFGIMLEVFVAFLILFAVGSLGANYYKGYAQPVGIQAEKVWAVYAHYNTTNDTAYWESTQLFKQKVKSFREVQHVSLSQNNVPYGFSHSNGNVKYKDKDVHTEFMMVEETYPSVLGLEMVEGSWFKNTDTMQKSQPVVITQTLKEALFGNESAIGKRLGESVDSWVVVGVTGAFKFQNEFQKEDHCVFRAIGKGADVALVKVDPSVDAAFEAQFAKSIQNLGKDWTVEVQHLDEMKTQANSVVVIPMTILCIVAGFLIVNVLMGLLGVLFQNINRRRAEIGVRRALGATERGITQHFIGETLVIATFSVLLGLFFAIQFPILKIFDVENSIYFTGIAFATVMIYALVAFCAFYPSWQAAKIQPAMALHEN
jgi:putative ABC transport system permease protein